MQHRISFFVNKEGNKEINGLGNGHFYRGQNGKGYDHHCGQIGKVFRTVQKTCAHTVSAALQECLQILSLCNKAQQKQEEGSAGQGDDHIFVGILVVESGLLRFVQYGNKAVDREFTYIVPSSLRSKIKVGHRVRVLFNNREIEGFVLSLCDSYDGEYSLNEIISLVDEEPILNEEMLYIGNKLCEKILCSKISSYQVMLPKALKASGNTNMNIKNNRYAVLNVSMDLVNVYIDKCRYEGQKKILLEIIKNGRVLVNSKNSSYDTLINKGIIKYVYEEAFRYSVSATGRYKNVILNVMKENLVLHNKFTTQFLLKFLKRYAVSIL